MNLINKMTLTVLAYNLNDAFARSTVAAFCTELNPTVEEFNDIKTAVSEAFTNCVVHAYGNKGGDIVITAQLYDDRSLEITITDTGVGIEDVAKAMQAFYTTRPEEERSGMGFTLMQTFMTSLDVKSEKGKGTTVRLAKKLADR